MGICETNITNEQVPFTMVLENVELPWVATPQSEMYVWRSAGYIRKSLVIFGYLWNAIRTVLFRVGYSRASLTMYDNI